MEHATKMLESNNKHPLSNSTPSIKTFNRGNERENKKSMVKSEAESVPKIEISANSGGKTVDNDKSSRVPFERKKKNESLSIDDIFKLTTAKPPIYYLAKINKS